MVIQLVNRAWPRLIRCKDAEAIQHSLVWFAPNLFVWWLQIPTVYEVQVRVYTYMVTQFWLWLNSVAKPVWGLPMHGNTNVGAPWLWTHLVISNMVSTPQRGQACSYCLVVAAAEFHSLCTCFQASYSRSHQVPWLMTILSNFIYELPTADSAVNKLP